MRWFLRAAVSDCSILRLCCLSITLLSSPSAPQFLLPFSGSFIPFLPPPIPIPYRPPSFTCQRRFSLSLHLFLPTPLLPSRRATVHLDGAPACRPPPLVCAFLPCRESQRSSSSEPCLPSPVQLPPLAVLDLCPGSCRLQVYPVQGSFPPSACLNHPHACSPPCRPRPAAQPPDGPRWWRCVLRTVYPVLPPRPSRVPRRLLVSSGV